MAYQAIVAYMIHCQRLVLNYLLMTNNLDKGALWDEFCAQLQHVGRHVLRSEVPNSDTDKAEGYRYLTRVLRSSLDTFLEYRDASHPVIFRPCDEIIKYGGDNPDNWYQKCYISGKKRYRIYGKRGTVDYLSFLTQGSNYGQDRTMSRTGFLDDNDIVLSADGSFDIIVSAQKEEGNWLPMREETEALLIRQTFAKRDEETIADIHIQCLNPDTPTPPPMDAAFFAEALRNSTRFLDATVGLFCDWSERYQKHCNQLPKEDQDMCQRVGGDPNICYYNSYWELKPDQVLLVELPTIPECQSWNFQLCNYWMESLDYRYHKIHINKSTADYEPDGSVRIAVAHRDPHMPNWLTTAGHERGTMLFRWIGAKSHPDPVTRVVPLQ